MDSILSGLNPEQKQAVQTLNGPVLILAGAGSGKTKTLTHRIANLILHGVLPSNILAVTFTNKAANEMRERLWALTSCLEAGRADPSPHAVHPHGLDRDFRNASRQDASTWPPRSFMPYMGTFHGIAVKILRQEAEAVGLDRNFVIYDTEDQISLIRRIMKELKLSDNKNLKPKSIQSLQVL